MKESVVKDKSMCFAIRNPDFNRKVNQREITMNYEL